ncbi:MAG: IS200/IS605 family transposase [Selenomonadaceae bacterium]
MDSLSLAHAKWKCQYHIVFIPKYRKKVLYGKVRLAVREVLQKLCRYKNVEIVSGAVCIDHVHLCVSIPPKMAVAKFVGYLKGKSTLMIHDMHTEIGGKWDKAFWARGYYVGTVGNITEEAIKKYIEEQEVYAKTEDKPKSGLF